MPAWQDLSGGTKLVLVGAAAAATAGVAYLYLRRSSSKDQPAASQQKELHMQPVGQSPKDEPAHSSKDSAPAAAVHVQASSTDQLSPPESSPLPLEPASPDSDAAAEPESSDRGRLYEVEELEDELQVSLLCPNNASKQDVKCQITPKKLKLTVQGETLLAGTFYGAVIPDESIWQFDASTPTRPRSITLTLSKNLSNGHPALWGQLLIGEEHGSGNA